MPIVRWFVCVAAVVVSLGAVGSARAASLATTLEWTAPGDDALIGTATGYDIRFSRDPINAANFALANRLTSMLLPGPPGTRQTFSITGLTPGVTYFFAVKTVDEKGNWSPVSNIATLVASSVDAQTPVVSEPHFSNPWPNPARAGARFTVSLPRAQALRIEAFDITGRKVKTLALGEYSAGTFDLTWDLRDDSGRSLKASTYLVRGQVGERVFLRRVAVVR